MSRDQVAVAPASTTTLPKDPRNLFIHSSLVRAWWHLREEAEAIIEALPELEKAAKKAQEKADKANEESRGASGSLHAKEKALELVLSKMSEMERTTS